MKEAEERRRRRRVAKQSCHCGHLGMEHKEEGECFIKGCQCRTFRQHVRTRAEPRTLPVEKTWVQLEPSLNNISRRPSA